MPIIELAAHESDSMVTHGLFLGVLGYEERCTHVYRKLVHENVKALICHYDNVKEFSYHVNHNLYRSSRAILVEAHNFAKYLLHEIDQITTEEVNNNIIINLDISSMTRSTMAEVMNVIRKTSLVSTVYLKIFYTVAKFERPPRRFPPIKESGPVHSAFCGVPSFSGRPTKLILALGYEGGRSIAAIEEFEVNTGWIFFPVGKDPSYEKLVYETNRGLLQSQHGFHVVKYDVSQPATICALIDQVVRASKRSFRPILVPFGPKIFTICSLIVLLQHVGEVTLWRMSGGVEDAVMDRIASGEVTMFNLIIRNEA